LKFDPSIHRRRSIRLRGYDYTRPGAYFVTLVTQGRVCLFGKVEEGEMRLNAAGEIVRQEWLRLPRRFASVKLDAFVIMPNHIHAILVNNDLAGTIRHGNPSDPPVVGATQLPLDRSMDLRGGSPLPARPRGPIPGSLGAIIGQFKSRVTKRLGLSFPIWQRNYYEHIVRSAAEWERIAGYIRANPANWRSDREFSG
jgi:REP element-mobilizing transposase RayT